MNPLRENFSVTDKDGKSYPLRFELADFSFAQREPSLKAMGVKLTPFGATEFWETLDTDPVFGNLVLLYVGLRRSGIAGLSLDWIVEHFPTENLLNTVTPELEKALADFSQRIVQKAPTLAAGDAQNAA
jgi:hypothetical protein